LSAISFHQDGNVHSSITPMEMSAAMEWDSYCIRKGSTVVG